MLNDMMINYDRVAMVASCGKVLMVLFFVVMRALCGDPCRLFMVVVRLLLLIMLNFTINEVVAILVGNIFAMVSSLTVIFPVVKSAFLLVVVISFGIADLIVMVFLTIMLLAVKIILILFPVCFRV